MQTAPEQQPAIPRHVAIIMDGNGRWAHARHLPRTAGHKQGVTAARKVVQWCRDHGVQVLTLFAFSSENWQRPPKEVSTLMDLFFSTLKREAKALAENGIRLHFIGAREAFSDKLQRQIQAAEELTSQGETMVLNIAASYGGRWDITQAVRRLVDEVQAKRMSSDQITSDAIAARLSTAGLREPDLFIRTGGEQRISNFLLWQLAYTELYFTDTLWPDFDEEALGRACEDYARRQRRFGMTAEQVDRAHKALTHA